MLSSAWWTCLHGLLIVLWHCQGDLFWEGGHKIVVYIQQIKF